MMFQIDHELSEEEIRQYGQVLELPYTPDSTLSPQQTLERYFDRYRCIINVLRAHYTIAVVGSNLIYLLFPMMTSNEGINTIVRLIDSKISVPPLVGYGIGAPLSLVEVVYFILMFSPKREAILSAMTIIPRATESATEGEWLKAFLKRVIANCFGEIRAFQVQPLWGLLSLGETILHWCILLSFNLTWISASLVFLPPPWGLHAALLVLLWGEEYCRLYSNRDYYEGVQFFKREWRSLLHYAKENPLIMMQIIAQSGSGIGIRVFPISYYLSLQAKRILGYWPPEAWIMAAATAQGVGSLFLPSFRYYTADQLALADHFALEGNMADLSSQLQRFSDDWRQQHGYFRRVMDAPAVALLILMRTCLGGYLGYATSQYIDVPMAWILAPLFALLLGIHLYVVEMQRMISSAHYLSLNQAPIREQPIIPRSTTFIASLVNVCGAFSTTLSNMGLLCFVFGDDQSIAKAFILMVSLESMLNLILFNQKKCEETIHRLRQSAPTCRSAWCSWFQSPQTITPHDHNIREMPAIPL